MVSAKQIEIRPITAKAANQVVKAIHYSGKVVSNSQLHFGAFLGGRLEGAMSFGPSMDKSKVIGLVEGTPWNGFLELNRMAFSDRLPRNSESRALGFAIRTIKREYPHIQWIISFSDGAQCGDGTIYRASGFKLTGMRENQTILRFPDGTTMADISLRAGQIETRRRAFAKLGLEYDGTSSVKRLLEAGAQRIPGYQLRYMRFIHPTAEARLTVPIIPFDAIDEVGAGMYLGQRRRREKQAT